MPIFWLVEFGLLVASAPASAQQPLWSPQADLTDGFVDERHRSPAVAFAPRSRARAMAHYRSIASRNSVEVAIAICV